MNQLWRGLGSVVAVAVIARGAVAAAALMAISPFDQMDQDPDSYRQIAQTLSESGTFGITAAGGSVDPTAFRPPLYPWLLSWMVTGGELPAAAVLLLHAFVGVATCVGVWDIVRRLSSGSQAAAIVAGCLTAIDPLLLMQSTLVMTETLAAGIVVAAWWAGVRAWNGDSHPFQRQAAPRRWGLIVAAALAAGYLCRPVFIIWAALWIAYLAALAISRSTNRRLALFQATVMCLALAATIGLWTLRNQRVIGAPVWATTHGGYTLLLGNNRYFYDYLDSRSFAEAAFWGEAWDADPFHHDWAQRLEALTASRPPGEPTGEWRPDEELAADRLAGELAREQIRRRPAMFIYASLVRTGRLWSPVPRIGNSVGLVSWVIGGFYVAIGIGVGLGLWRCWRTLASPAWAPALLLLVAVTLVHAVYWSNLRMRAPVMPVIAAIAALGFLGFRPALPQASRREN